MKSFLSLKSVVGPSIVAFGLIAILPVALADEKKGPTSDTKTLAAQVETLKALPSAERRALLREMSKEDRQGLWFELQRSRALEKDQEAATRGAGYAASRKPTTAASKAAQAVQFDAVPRAMGSIQYDDNNINTTFGGGAIIGNRFDTALGNTVTASGTVDTVQAVVVQGPAFTTSSAGFVLLGPQTGGGGAMAIFSTFTGATGVTDTVTFTGIGASYTGSSFFVLFGDFANSYVPAFGTGSVNAQGHHGIVGYTGGMGPNITGTFDFGGTRNGLVRVTGNVLPVELLSFEGN